jgi:hypothetical protein
VALAKRAVATKRRASRKNVSSIHREGKAPPGLELPFVWEALVVLWEVEEVVMGDVVMEVEEVVVMALASTMACITPDESATKA